VGTIRKTWWGLSFPRFPEKEKGKTQKRKSLAQKKTPLKKGPATGETAFNRFEIARPPRVQPNPALSELSS